MQPTILDHRKLCQVVVALEPGALLRGSVARNGRHDSGSQRTDRGVVLRQGEIDHAHLARELAVFIDREHVSEPVPVVSLGPETVPGLLDATVGVDGRELRDHEGARRTRVLREQIVLRERLLQGFLHLLGSQDGQVPERRQRLLRMDLSEYEREHPGAEPGADPRGLDGIHLPQHPGYGLGRHHPDHRVSTGAGQPGNDGADVGRVEVANQLPGGVRPAGADQLADLVGDLLRLVERYRLALFDPGVREPQMLGKAACVVHLPPPCPVRSRAEPAQSTEHGRHSAGCDPPEPPGVDGHAT